MADKSMKSEFAHGCVFRGGGPIVLSHGFSNQQEACKSVKKAGPLKFIHKRSIIELPRLKFHGFHDMHTCANVVPILSSTQSLSFVIFVLVSQYSVCAESHPTATEGHFLRCRHSVSDRAGAVPLISRRKHLRRCTFKRTLPRTFLIETCPIQFLPNHISLVVRIRTESNI